MVTVIIRRAGAYVVKRRGEGHVIGLVVAALVKHMPSLVFFCLEV